MSGIQLHFVKLSSEIDQGLSPWSRTCSTILRTRFSISESNKLDVASTALNFASKSASVFL
jgi:hypothetical protein